MPHLLSDRNFSIIVTATSVILGAIFAFHHEMWRDEIQAWLIARDSSSVIELFRNLKYEGHPGLWHLCLMPLSRITWSPVMMQVFHIVIAAASVYIFCRFSPFHKLQKALFAFGYFTFYEYSIICRNYAPGILLLFIFCTLFEKRFTRFPLMGIILFLLAHTSVHCLIITIALFIALLVECLFTRKGNLKILLGFSIMALGIATSIIQLKPPADSGFAVAWTMKYDYARLRDVFHIVERAFAPIPKSTLHFWNSNIFASSVRVKSIISCAVIVCALILLLEKRVSLLIYISGTIGLLGFFYVKYFGSMRHHGFLFILFIVSTWVSYYCGDAKRLRVANRLSSIARKYIDIPLALILIAQLAGGAAAARMDYIYTFSQGKAVARYIKESRMEDMTMIGEMDYAVSTIAGYLGNRIYYVRGNRLGSFVIWDKDRTANVTPEDVLQKAKELEEQNPLIILNSSLNEDLLSRYAVTELSRFENAVVGNEVYYLYMMGDN
jgi:hypothetical protein